MKKTHGMGKTLLYGTWQNIKRRCNKKNCQEFPRYGGRGIKICSRWSDSFINFYEDMGERPSPAHSLDRIDNDGDYEPSNCRWATSVEQQRNRSNNRVINFRGMTEVMSRWAEITGIHKATLSSRIDHGWTVEKALTTPVRKQTMGTLTFNGETKTLPEWSRSTGIKISTLHSRFRSGTWSIEELLTTSALTRHKPL